MYLDTSDRVCRNVSPHPSDRAGEVSPDPADKASHQVPETDHDDVVLVFELPTSIPDACRPGGSRIINSVNYKDLRKNMTIDYFDKVQGESKTGFIISRVGKVGSTKVRERMEM